MSFGVQKTIVLTKEELKDLESFCALNGLDIDTLIKDSFKQGYRIEKYGLLGNMGGIQEKRVEIEVIREKRVEIPVEVIKEVVKIEYVEVPVEKIVEVIKEVPVEKVVINEVIKEVPVEKIVTIYDNSSENELLLKIQQLESEKQIFSTKLQECDGKLGIFSTKTTEMENIFHYKMSKKDEELDELRHSLDELKQNTDKPDNTNKLQETLQKIRQQVIDRDVEISELKSKINELNKLQHDQKALYLKGSNLDNKLYK